MLMFLFSLSFAQEPTPSKPAPEPTQIVDAQHIKASLVLKVENKDDVAVEIISSLESKGGYYSVYTDTTLQLRVPTSAMEAFIQECSQKGVVASRTFQSHSLGQDLAEVYGKLKSREELLSKYFQILNESKVETVTTVEREVINLISQIENLKAQKNTTELQAQYSALRIDFQFKDRRQPVASGVSSFDWLNTLNVQDVVEVFQYNRVPSRSKSFCIDVPKGFAKYQVSRETRGASFDGVLYRARKYKSKQVADNSFWAEAIVNRMLQAGYFGYQGKDIATQKLDNGYQIIRTIAPLGEEDYSYWIAFRAEKNIISIIEGAGEVSDFEKHKDVILDAVRARK